MPTNDDISHGIIRHAAISLATIGTMPIGANITMPADGPWIIYGIHSASVMELAPHITPYSYHLQLESITGDMLPATTPSEFPGMAWNQDDIDAYRNQAYPVHIYPTNISIPGKGILKLNIINEIAQAITPRFMAGILFGKTIPSVQPLKYPRMIAHQFTSTFEQFCGTFYMSEGWSRITGIYSYPILESSAGGSGPALYSLRLSTNDKKLQPAEFPGNFFAPRTNPSTNISGFSGQESFIPLDITLEPGSAIDLFATMPFTPAGTTIINTFLAME